MAVLFSNKPWLFDKNEDPRQILKIIENFIAPEHTDDEYAGVLAIRSEQ